VDLDKILEQGLAVVESEGHDALSIRGLARDLGVSAPALYEYIRSRDDLLRLLAQRGYDELALQWRSIGGPPVDWLVQTGQAYVTFAVEHPQLFSLMHRFGPGALIGDPDVEHPAATILFDEGMDQIGTAIAAGDLRADEPFDLAVALWAAAHGVATVAIMAPDLVDHRDLADRVLGGLLEAWRPQE
jgi:AcrR family transcriptional regulator